MSFQGESIPLELGAVNEALLLAGEAGIHHRHLNTRPDPNDYPNTEVETFLDLCSNQWSLFECIRLWMDNEEYWRAEEAHFEEVNESIREAHQRATGKLVTKADTLSISPFPPLDLIRASYEARQAHIRRMYSLLPSAMQDLG